MSGSFLVCISGVDGMGLDGSRVGVCSVCVFSSRFGCSACLSGRWMGAWVAWQGMTLPTGNRRSHTFITLLLVLLLVLCWCVYVINWPCRQSQRLRSFAFHLPLDRNTSHIGCSP
jgi:hypothetical protein